MIASSIHAIYKVNLGIKKWEKALVFTDRITSNELVSEEDMCRRERLRDIALLTAEIGKPYTKRILYHEYPSVTSHGTEPPAELWELAFGCKTVDELKKQGLLKRLLSKKITDEEIVKAEGIIKRRRNSAVNAVIALSNFSTSHTRFRDFLTRVCGCRYASMPLFDASMLESAMNVDWKALKKRTEALAKIINKAVSIEIKTPNGTILSLSKKERKTLIDAGILTKPGSFSNLPAGEVYIAPVEGSADGKLVLEWAPTRELKTAITLFVESGKVKKVEGDEPYADYLMAKINERPENANIAELGIGTNDMARRPDNILESEKILGTIHIALGDNSSFGGKVKTPFHQDFLFFKPTLTLRLSDRAKIELIRNGRVNF